MTPTGYKIIRHDCEVDQHSWAEIGPFGNRDDAQEFIERTELWRPVDGGYAFAFVTPADDAYPLDDPSEWDGPDENNNHQEGTTP